MKIDHGESTIQRPYWTRLDRVDGGGNFSYDSITPGIRRYNHTQIDSSLQCSVFRRDCCSRNDNRGPHERDGTRAPHASWIIRPLESNTCFHRRNAQSQTYKTGGLFHGLTRDTPHKQVQGISSQILFLCHTFDAWILHVCIKEVQKIYHDTKHSLSLPTSIKQTNAQVSELLRTFLTPIASRVLFGKLFAQIHQGDQQTQCDHQSVTFTTYKEIELPDIQNSHLPRQSSPPLIQHGDSCVHASCLCVLQPAPASVTSTFYTYSYPIYVFCMCVAHSSFSASSGCTVEGLPLGSAE